MKERPSYYAVIPAGVRYDTRLSANAKLLYGEITALSSKEGYCWAGNQYFADLYGTTPRTARRWITELETGGYITIGYKYVAGTNEIETRRIRITETGGDKNVTTCQQPPPGPEAKTPENLDTETAVQEQTPPKTEPPAGGDKNVTTCGQKCQGVVTKMSEGGDKNATYIITSNNTKESSSSQPSPDRTDEEGENKSRPDRDVRKLLSPIDNTLIFDYDFYLKAARFLDDEQLPDEYLSWLYKICKEQKPVNLRNYYYKLFFSEQMVELYRQSKNPPGIPVQRYEPCPVCGEPVSVNEKSCPCCRFDMAGKGDGEKLNAALEERRQRNAEIDKLREKNMDTAQLIKKIAEMNKRRSA
jgi:hypothetical protein